MKTRSHPYFVTNASGLVVMIIRLILVTAVIAWLSGVTLGVRAQQKQESPEHSLTGVANSATEAERVYVVGNVGKPQGLFLKGTMTLTEAIALAGGLLPDSKTDRIRLIRQTAGSSICCTQITVDLKAIRKRRAVDPELRPNDIIEVLKKHDRPSKGGGEGIVQ